MDSYKRKEMHEVQEATSNTATIRIYYVEPSWRMKDGTVKGWKVLFERTAGQPEWVLTYHESLAVPGPHMVEFGKNSQHQRTIKPIRS